MTTNDIAFHLLSFEGPDAYSRAGGIATRISGLFRGLAERAFETHLWFVGDPALAGYETDGRASLHRWCQWISAYHPLGVYQGEDGKLGDYASSLPPYLLDHYLRPQIEAGGTAVVLAEEWHTVHAVLHLDWLLRCQGLRDRVRILWNANNTFGFDRIDWARLARAATITTVSRYMKHLMWGLGVDPIALPNGLATEAFLPPDEAAVGWIRHRFAERTVISKVARWDPDKRWLLAVRTAAELERQGARPLLIARGGMEAHGADVLREAAASGLEVVDRSLTEPGAAGLVKALDDINGADVVNVTSPLDIGAIRTLFRASNAVLANSGREPFGLVGLEAMAAGGVACTGCTGEDYVVPGENALVLQTDDPREFPELYRGVRANGDQERSIRTAGAETARRFAWPEVIERHILPRVRIADR